jgi:lipopolysaccharide/colanic/teichoic acid biosynthesis glycosyltransferase
VFFVQQRVGLHGRLFPMVKFRSMEKDAARRNVEMQAMNETDGVAFKMRLDPRVTPVGRILRKFHLDELPQLWSVLVGDMSLVGPRPLPPEEANRKEWWQRRRLSMPPGLTCFWQVEGDHLMPFSRWMQMDLDYIDGWSLWLDLKLIAWTFGAVAKGKGW